jgi:hypothetical protein
MDHDGMVADGHDRIPVYVPSIDQFKRRLDKIFGDLPLGNHIHYRQQKDRLLWIAVVGNYAEAVWFDNPIDFS